MKLEEYKTKVQTILNNQSYRTKQMNDVVSLFIKYKNNPCPRTENELHQAITGYWYKQEYVKETRMKWR